MASLTSSATVTPADPLGQLAGISERDCLDATIAELANLTNSGSWKFRGGRSTSPETAKDQGRHLPIPILALRYEAHSVADDKRGTIFPLRVTVDGTEGISYFAVSNRLKVALYSFIQGSCARQ